MSTWREILREISPENLQRDLVGGQKEIDEFLTMLDKQLARQSESKFGSKTWREASWSKFGHKLIHHGDNLIRFGKMLSRE